jgi:hypothetical protein
MSADNALRLPRTLTSDVISRIMPVRMVALYLLHRLSPNITCFMKISYRALFAVLSLVTLSACSRSDPGPLAGTWRMGGVVPMTVQFRDGETETMGLIEKVSYDIKGDQVLVKYESGPMQGTAVRFTVTGPNSARSDFGIFQRIN